MVAVTHKLLFSSLHEYDTRENGITVPVRLTVEKKMVDIAAKLDTGASFCIFRRVLGEILGLDIESGQKQAVRTVTGSFITYGHNVTLATLGLTFDVMVYFATDYNFARDVLGQQGWLNQVRIGIVDHDGKIYISKYDDQE